jgi:D-arabinose 1-dehydrogenase-like Zn-dependent alcohol dehydrogenase
MRHTRVIVTHYGGPEALRVVEEECPEPADGEARVSVLAAGVSLPDIMAREGVHPETPPLPFTPGWDLVGVVDRLGNGVSGIAPGQVVAALPIHGAYAEFVCLPQRELVPVPSGLDAAEAVSLVLNYITAYQMLHRSAKVRSGQRVLIHGAAGGVGTAQHPDAQAAEPGVLPTGSDRPVRPPSTGEDQAAHRAAISPGRGETRAGAAREGRRHRQDRARARRGIAWTGAA